MRRRIVWLVAATTSAVVVSFIVPLALLVANLAEDRASARAKDQAQGVSILVATIEDRAVLLQAVESLSVGGPAVLVVTPDGAVLGGPATLPPDTGSSVQRARRDSAAFTIRADHGVDAIVPIATASGLAIVVATVPESEVRAGVSRAWATIIALGAVLIVASVLLARELGRRITTPLTEVAAVAHRLREGDRTARASGTGPPEALEVGTALNSLADRIDVLVDAERERVADLGHRLRTPMTALNLDTELIEDEEVAARLREHVAHLQRSVDTVVREARRPVREVLSGTCDLRAVVLDRVAFWSPLAEDQSRALRVTDPFAASVASATSSGSTGSAPVASTRRDFEVRLPAVDVRELVDTLLDNVFAHTPEGVPFAVELAAGAGEVRLTVSDGGPGLDPAYRGRGSSGSGSSGLGLDIVSRIARTGGGSVALDRGPLGGLAVTVTLPRTP